MAEMCTPSGPGEGEEAQAAPGPPQLGGGVGPGRKASASHSPYPLLAALSSCSSTVVATRPLPPFPVRYKQK